MAAAAQAQFGAVVAREWRAKGIRNAFFGLKLKPRLRTQTLRPRISTRCETTVSKESGISGPCLLPAKRVLLGFGGVSFDFLVGVASYPQPDDKIRSTEFLAQGGGNVGNALTAAARLGLSPRCFCKIANDTSGSKILAELQHEGIDVSHMLVTSEGTSPFTYVIVDKKTGTRTCIHTPGYPALHPTELCPKTISRLLDGVDLVYFDGRLTDSATLVAKESSRRKLPILVEAERVREGLDELLEIADYIVASTKFPLAWTGTPTFADALITMAHRLPQLKFVIVTLGASGCLMFERNNSDNDDVLSANSTFNSLLKEAKEHPSSKPAVFSSKVGKFCLSQAHNADDYVVGRLLIGTADVIPEMELVDTTGAGDAFIGGVLYSICGALAPEKMLRISATVAAAKCRGFGARTGLPSRDDPRVLPLLL